MTIEASTHNTTPIPFGPRGQLAERLYGLSVPRNLNA
jgi:hypothetical protein